MHRVCLSERPRKEMRIPNALSIFYGACVLLAALSSLFVWPLFMLRQRSIVFFDGSVSDTTYLELLYQGRFCTPQF